MAITVWRRRMMMKNTYISSHENVRVLYINHFPTTITKNPIPIRFGMEAIWEEKSISVITLAEAPGSILQTGIHDRKKEIGVRREM